MILCGFAVLKMAEKNLTISSSSDLYQLLLRGIFKRKNRVDRIVLKFDRLSSEEITNWQKTLNDLYTDCGCSAGSLVLITSMAIYFVFILFTKGIPNITGYDLLIGVGIFFGSAGIGKIIGIQLARKKFRENVKQLITELEKKAS